METEIALLKQGALGYSDAQGHPNSGADTAFPKQGAPDYSDAQDIETLRGPKRRFGERLLVDLGKTQKSVFLVALPLRPLSPTPRA